MTQNETTTKLTGTISYEIVLSEEGYNITFTPSDELDEIKNALASVARVRMIASNSVAEMQKCKEEDRLYYNEHFKKIFHPAKKLLKELETVEAGIIADLLETEVVRQSAFMVAKSAEKPIVTVQNPITEE